MFDFITKLDVTPVDGSTDYWTLNNDLLLYIDGPYYVIVPEGFDTDFASVPRLLWTIIPKWGTYGKAAVVHDFMYRHKQLPRDKADLIFHDCMIYNGVPAWKAKLMYLAVRAFGGFSYGKIVTPGLKVDMNLPSKYLE